MKNNKITQKRFMFRAYIVVTFFNFAKRQFQIFESDKTEILFHRLKSLNIKKSESKQKIKNKINQFAPKKRVSVEKKKFV